MPASSLTEREKWVMELLIQGKRDREIGMILGIRAHSVATKMERICNKLGAETRAQAAAIFLKNGNIKEQS